jgi:hypothetical protein
MRREWLLETIPALLLGCAMIAHAAEPRSFHDGTTISLIVSSSPGGATDLLPE